MNCKICGLPIACGDMCHTECVEARDAARGWVSVKDRLPEPERDVLICANRNGYFVITTGIYEDGAITTEDSSWVWPDHDFEYDENRDTYIVPEGWWESKQYSEVDEYNNCVDNVVTHWMPLPEPPEEGYE